MHLFCLKVEKIVSMFPLAAKVYMFFNGPASDQMYKEKEEASLENTYRDRLSSA